jgi:hypothetical protein
MRLLALLCGITLIVGCAPREEQPAADTETAPAMVSLADFAGTWDVSGMAETGDSVIVTYELTATAEPDGWTVIFPGRDPIPMQIVLVDGDSVVSEMGPYESALRPGVPVTTRAVSRLEDGMLVGTFVARYDTDAADSVLHGRQHGSRKTP